MQEDDIIAQIETDKVTIDVKYSAKEPAKLTELLVAEGVRAVARLGWAGVGCQPRQHHPAPPTRVQHPPPPRVTRTSARVMQL